MKRFLSILLAVLMLAVMLPVTAMAAGAPTQEGNVWKNVDPNNIQALLDGQYGSINGTTIELSAGTYGQLELGRATKHPGSNTTWYNGKWDGTAWIRVEPAVDKVENINRDVIHFYDRTISGVTLKAAPNAEISVAGIKMTSGHIYGVEGTPAKDYVLDFEISSTVNSYYLAQTVSNITFEGITFAARSDINTSNERTTINGITFRNCTFNINNTAADNQAIRYYNENNNSNLTNLTVENCKFNNCFQGVLATNTKNITVKDCTFDTTGHNAIAIQDSGACDHGNVVITGNTFNNIGDRIIRFNKPAEGTTITITKNTAVNSGKDVDGKKEVIAAEITPLEGVSVTMAGNKWGENTKFGKGFENVVDKPIPEPSGPIIIYPPTDDTPNTTTGNPTTGANDFVGIAAAAAVVALLGSAVILRKK